MKKLLLGALVLFNTLIFYSQSQNKCSFPNPTDQNLKQISSLLQSSSKSGTKRIIPIVFHVLHQNGVENISNAQIFDQMNILNADFQKLNADTIDIVSPFDTIFDAPNFEFRLATIDPNGNPTNGIDRINTVLTNNFFPLQSVNIWNAENYVNVWVVRSAGGVGGHIISSPYDINSCPSGIAVLHSFVGSIGTSTPVNSRALTHEMGHFFGLFHIWDSTFYAGPTICSYSDGIDDTPNSISQGTICDSILNTCDDTTDPLTLAYWGYDVFDNIQNFMSFSFCSNMFTNMQSELMRSVGENPLYGRYNLHTDSNLIATGTGPGPIISATNLPYVEFSAQNRLICSGDSIHFTNSCGNPANTSYSWTFTGGFPASSTLPNPLVFYPTNGLYDVTLAVTSPNGTSTLTKSIFAQVVGNWADYTGPTQQVFDSLSPFWLVQNLEENTSQFELISSEGVSNSACYKLTNDYIQDTSIACWNQFGSANQLNGNKDVLISPAFDLRTTTNVQISFDYAYGSASNPLTGTEKLIVYSTRNCGGTWIQRANLNASNLITAPVFQGSNFIPTSTQWETRTFNYIVNNQDDKTRFKFEFSASDSSNNLFIDNFIVSGILNLSTNELAQIEVFPNPIKTGDFVNIRINNPNLDIHNIELFDAQGASVLKLNTTDVIEMGGFSIYLNQGYYFLKIENQNGFRMQKVIVQ